MTIPYGRFPKEAYLSLLDQALQRRWVQAVLFVGVLVLAWAYGPRVAEARSSSDGIKALPAARALP